MRPEELKALRAELGLTQSQFSKAIGLSRALIGQMERGQAPIEKRTALSARYLALQGRDHVLAMNSDADSASPVERAIKAVEHILIRHTEPVAGGLSEHAIAQTAVMAVLNAIRQPSDAMAAGGAQFLQNPDQKRKNLDLAKQASTVWAAMIEAAIKPEDAR